MALTDWQCFGLASWARDVAYTLGTALTVENRRAWGDDLLRFYLERLREAGGPDVGFDAAFSLYRRHLLSALTFWTSTLALAKTQPRDATLEFIKRITTAMDDAGSLDGFDA